MAAHDSTRPWRKSHRRKYREGSTYRDLTLLQRELLRWIEDNADDQGRAGPTTERWLAQVFSSRYETISRDAVHRASVALERVGLALREPHQEPHLSPHLAPTVYVRVNWDKYQDKPESPHQEPHRKVDDSRTDLEEVSRGLKKKMGSAADAAAPGWQELVAGLDGCWTATYQGQKYVWQGRDFKAMKALRKSIPDAEILRRFGNYLSNRDPFYAGHPVGLFCSQVNRFVAGAVPDIRVGSAPAESHESFRARGGGVQPW